MKNYVIAVIALSGIAFAPAAFAEDIKPVEFQYDRQQLSTEEGANKVYQALREKIEEACAESWSVTGSSSVNRQNQCVTDAVQNALAQMNETPLTIAHHTHQTTQQS